MFLSRNTIPSSIEKVEKRSWLLPRPKYNNNKIIIIIIIIIISLVLFFSFKWDLLPCDHQINLNKKLNKIKTKNTTNIFLSGTNIMKIALNCEFILLRLFCVWIFWSIFIIFKIILCFNLWGQVCVLSIGSIMLFLSKKKKNVPGE